MRLNNAPVLDQMEEHWQKLLMILLYKLKGGEQVVIKSADIAALDEAFKPGMPILFTHGMADGIGLQIVTEEKAAELVAYQNELDRRTTSTKQ